MSHWSTLMPHTQKVLGLSLTVSNQSSGVGRNFILVGPVQKWVGHRRRKKGQTCANRKNSDKFNLQYSALHCLYNTLCSTNRAQSAHNSIEKNRSIISYSSSNIFTSAEAVASALQRKVHKVANKHKPT